MKKNNDSDWEWEFVPLDASLRKRLASGKITLREASVSLYKAGWYSYIPSEEETIKRLKLEH